MRRSFWTTLFGLMAGLPQLLPFIGVEAFGHIGAVTVDQFLTGIGLIGLGAMAKDRNVTGGTVAATTEAERRVQ